MNHKFNVGDIVDVKNAGVGMVEEVRETHNPLTFEFAYRYRIMFYGGYIRYHNEDELEIHNGPFCDISNNNVQDSSTRPCYYLKEKATFHRWVDETKMIMKFDGRIRVDKFKEIKQTYEEHGIIYPGMDVTPIVNTFALIELKDGSMKKVPPEEIRFVNEGN
jgi:hypothetical protein